MTELPKAYREIWEAPRRTWLRVVGSFALSVFVWTCFIIAIIVVATEFGAK